MSLGADNATAEKMTNDPHLRKLATQYFRSLNVTVGKVPYEFFAALFNCALRLASDEFPVWDTNPLCPRLGDF